MLATLRYMDKSKNLPGSNTFTLALRICMKPQLTQVLTVQFHPLFQDTTGHACGLQLIANH